MRALSGTFVTNAAHLSLGLLTGILTARGLEPENRGLLATCVMWVSIISLVTLLGADEGVIYVSNGKPTLAGRLVWALRTTLIKRVLFTSCVTLATLSIIARTADPALQMPELVLIGALVIPLGVWTQMWLATLRVADRYAMWNFVRTVVPLVYCLTLCAIFWFGLMSVESAMLALIAANVAAAALAWMLRPPNIRAGQIDPQEAIHFGKRLSLSAIPTGLQGRLDQLLLTLVAGPAYLGIYGIASSVAGLVTVGAITGEQVLFPRLRAGRISPRGLSVALLVASFFGSAALVLGLAVGERAIVAVYGVSYAGAFGPFKLLLAASALQVISAVLIAEAKSQDRLRFLARLQFVSMVGMVLAGLFGYYTAGPWGVAAGPLVSAVLTLGGLVLLRIRATDGSLLTSGA